MASLATLDADDLRAVMGGYRDALRLHQADINRLNVYPVPDGDTGTNMALTLEAVVAELARKAVVRPVEGTILTVASAAAEGAAHATGPDLLAVVEGARTGAADAL